MHSKLASRMQSATKLEELRALTADLESAARSKFEGRRKSLLEDCSRIDQKVEEAVRPAKLAQGEQEAVVEDLAAEVQRLR